MQTSRLLYDDWRYGRCRAVTRENPAWPSGCGPGRCRSGCEFVVKRGTLTPQKRAFSIGYSVNRRRTHEPSNTQPDKGGGRSGCGAVAGPACGRADGGRSRVALYGGACRGALQGVDGGEHPKTGQHAHPARVRQTPLLAVERERVVAFHARLSGVPYL